MPSFKLEFQLRKKRVINRNINSIIQLDQEEICLAGNNKAIIVFNIKDKNITYIEEDAHETNIKSLISYDNNIISISGKNCVKVWNYDKTKYKRLTLIRIIKVNTIASLPIVLNKNEYINILFLTHKDYFYTLLAYTKKNFTILKTKDTQFLKGKILQLSKNLILIYKRNYFEMFEFTKYSKFEPVSKYESSHNSSISEIVKLSDNKILGYDSNLLHYFIIDIK